MDIFTIALVFVGFLLGFISNKVAFLVKTRSILNTKNIQEDKDRKFLANSKWEDSIIYDVFPRLFKGIQQSILELEVHNTNEYLTTDTHIILYGILNESLKQNLILQLAYKNVIKGMYEKQELPVPRNLNDVYDIDHQFEKIKNRETKK